MVSTVQIPSAHVDVTCPQTRGRFKVRVAYDDSHAARVCGCSRFWGKLLCDAPCEADALAAFENLEAAQAALAETRYCGHPNVAAPRPREWTGP
jgi:hypothetical protein